MLEALRIAFILLFLPGPQIIYAMVQTKDLKIAQIKSGIKHLCYKCSFVAQMFLLV